MNNLKKLAETVNGFAEAINNSAEALNNFTETLKVAVELIAELNNITIDWEEGGDKISNID